MVMITIIKETKQNKNPRDGWWGQGSREGQEKNQEMGWLCEEIHTGPNRSSSETAESKTFQTYLVIPKDLTPAMVCMTSLNSRWNAIAIVIVLNGGGGFYKLVRAWLWINVSILGVDMLGESCWWKTEHWSCSNPSYSCYAISPAMPWCRKKRLTKMQSSELSFLAPRTMKQINF